MSSPIPAAGSLPTSAFHTFSLAAIRTSKDPSTSLAELTHANITLSTLGDLLEPCLIHPTKFLFQERGLIC